MKWLSVASCQFLVALGCAQEVHIPLHDGWQFQQVGKEEWYPAEVPGVVHTDLLRNGLIPDPYKGGNMDSVQWIENEDWIYKRTIFGTDTLLKHGHLDLVFKGLDTFAEVYLNDSLIGKADNMFRSWEWPVKDLLRKGENQLKVIFRSPIKEGAKLRDAYGIQLPHDNDPSGVSPYIRKAAYQFGWDFCPRLVTSGIWQGVELRGWSRARIRNVWIDENGGDVMIEPVLEIDSQSTVHVEAFLDDILLTSGNTEMPSYWLQSGDFSIWQPQGYGAQSLHRLRINLFDSGKLISTWADDIGICHVALYQEDDSIGQAFTVSVNQKMVFAKGANLVPPSMFPTSLSDSAWVDLVRAMRRSNMNMVRVWSGGIYPPEAFYDACDTAGIMVWQDLMFANIPPTDEAFARNVNSEIAELVRRLHHHPSRALWCGNNELKVAWENWGWQERYHLHGPDSTRITDGNEHFFNEFLGWGFGGDPLVDAYTPTSPLSNWGNAEGLKSGDLHYWGVWHGDSTFSSFKNNVGRFVSEYGFQSYPDSALLAKYIDPKELYLGSPTLGRLQRSYKTDKPIWEAMERELGEKPTTLGDFIEGSQRAQAKAYGMAIEAHTAAQPNCMGTLLWQLNDCWPGPSWSIIDFEGNPKPAYEVVKKLYSARP